MFNDEDDSYFADLPEAEVHEALKPPPPWEDGTYDATINTAIKYQGEGKPFPCVKLECTVANAEGKTKKIRTWVLSKNPAQGALRSGIQFLTAVGLKRSDYRNPAQLVGLSGKVKLATKGDYNEIANWIYSRN